MNSFLFWQIVQVYYPGLQSHPEHHIAKSQMSGFGGVVSFEVILCLFVPLTIEISTKFIGQAMYYCSS
jgi:Cys/Met metabolism PLP-dependent enzyme